MKPKPSNKGKSGVRIPENITVICVCGKVFTTAIDTREEDGFKCDCGVPIISPLNEEEEVK